MLDADFHLETLFVAVSYCGNYVTSPILHLRGFYFCMSMCRLKLVILYCIVAMQYSA